MVKVEKYDCSSFVACFWHTGDREWEGVISNELDNMDVSIIKSDRAIFLLRKTDFEKPVAVSSDNNLALR